MNRESKLGNEWEIDLSKDSPEEYPECLGMTIEQQIEAMIKSHEHKMHKKTEGGV